MVRALFILVPLVVAFWVFTIVDCAIQPPTRHRGVSKPVWLLIVSAIPVLGGILWLAVGRVRKSATRVYQAPDDDPEFLGSLGSITDQDERIRRLEEELAQLDSEDDDPRWRVPPVEAGEQAPPAPSTDGDDAAAPSADDAAAPSADGDDDPRGHRGSLG